MTRKHPRGALEQADALEAKARALSEKAAFLRATGGQELRLVPTPRADVGPPATDSSAALSALASALLPHLRHMLAAEQEGGALVDVCKMVPGPRRSLMGACRRAEIVGAVRIGRRWLAPRAAVEAWLRARGPRLVPSRADDDDDLESVRRSLATPGRRRRRR
jgi:hypothetical protein